MNTSEERKCDRCGAVIPRSSTDQLCPACLMSGALGAAGVETVSMPMGRSGSGSEPTEFPCQFGGYRLRGLLGRGGMGTVYDAQQIETGRRVALKMLGQQLDSPEMRQRFLREGRLAAGVSHPNSLYIFGSEEIEGQPAITMEIAGSGTLKDKLTSRGPLPTTEAVDAILDVIAGLEAALAAGVLHRDIKPSNCFVCPDGSVKIGDFGLSVSTLARDDSYRTAAGVIMGTPAYASPEQLRGDTLDVRADIYSVGATLFTLLTGRAPFEGDNAVQVVANAVKENPRPPGEFRDDVPPGLEQVVVRCLAKEPGARFADYPALRQALLPFSSQEPEPASIKIRASAGWIDYLIAFLVPYVILMLSIGNEQFHFRFIMQRTLGSAGHYIAFLGFGLLYFSIAEGIGGAGLGKRLKGLQVVRRDGRPPGIARALIRILIPIGCIEAIRMPVLLASISATEINDLTTAEIVIFSCATSICPLIPLLMTWGARRENGFATAWDLASGTRVVIKPKGQVRPSIQGVAQGGIPAESAAAPDCAGALGPYRITGELVPGEWIVAIDPVLRRQVWLLRRTSPELPLARQNIARCGRPRWLQKVEVGEVTWDAFEATEGMPFSSLVESNRRVPWAVLRHWLHDLASELWAAKGDQTLPDQLSLGHLWLTKQGRAMLLDQPWPVLKTPAEPMDVGDIASQQRFLSAIAARVESSSLPLHARPVLQNLADGKFEQLSFLTGTLRGILDIPAEVNRGMRAASIFMLPLYVWTMMFVGIYTADRAGESYGWVGWIAMTTIMLVLIGSALIQLIELPLRTTASHAIFRLAVVNAKGEPASRSALLVRWAIIWLPLMAAMLLVAGLFASGQLTAGFIVALALLLVWISAAIFAVIHPSRGLHDALAGTCVVRR